MADTVKVTLVIDEKGAVKAMRSAGDESGRTEGKFHKLDKEVKGLGKSFGGLKSMIGMGIGALGVGGLAVGLEGVVSNTREALTQTEKFSAISGTSAQQSLYLTSALKARGINAEVAGKAFAFLGSNIKTAERQENKMTLAQGIAAAKGKVTTTELGKQATAFRQLFGSQGVGALAGLSGEDKLKKVVKAFENLSPAIKKTGAQAALMKEIFGKGGTGLATVLEGGATGLTHFEEVAKRFFPQIKGGTRGLEEWATKNSEFHMGLEGLEVTLGMKLIPVLMTVEEWVTKTAGEVEKGRGPWGGFAKDIEGVVNAGKDVVGFMEGLGKAFNINIGAGGLGAALATFAGVKLGKKAVKPVTTTTKAVKKTAKFLEEHPYTAPLVIPAAAATAYGLDVYKSRKELAAHAKGGLNMFGGGPSTQRQIEESFLGGKPGTKYGPGGVPKAGGKPAAGETPSESALVAKLIAAMTPTNDKAEIHLHLDSTKVAEAVIHNPRARRVLAEATAIYAQGMTARK